MCKRGQLAGTGPLLLPCGTWIQSLVLRPAWQILSLSVSPVPRLIFKELCFFLKTQTNKQEKNYFVCVSVWCVCSVCLSVCCVYVLLEIELRRCPF